MKPNEILDQLQEIGNIFFSKEERETMIDLARKEKSAGIVIENYEIFVQREKTNDVQHFVEWFEEVMSVPDEFPDMPWEK